MKRCRYPRRYNGGNTAWPLIGIAFGLGVFLSFFSLRLVLLLSAITLIVLGVLLAKC